MLETYVRKALERIGMRPSRERGQHFLIDDSVLAQVIAAGQLSGDEVVVEIGPGLGTLTQSLAARVHRVEAYELDDRLSSYLTHWVLPEQRNIVLHDVAFNKYVFEPVLKAAQDEGRPLKIITNLPYQISSQFLQTVAEYSRELELVVVMLQREVAQRVIAKPGQPNYGSFSIYLQTFVEPRWVCDVPPESFMPPPRVHSAVLALHPLVEGARPRPANPQRYFKLVRGVFRHRRKQLRSALGLTFPHLNAEACIAALERADIDPSARPQNLALEDYVRLADALEQRGE